MTNEWDQYAADWDEDPAARAYARAAFASLVELVELHGAPSLAQARALDFGCGTGLLTEYLVAAGASVIAVDSSPAMLNSLVGKIERRNWSTVEAFAELPDSANGLDLIVCSSVCSFLDDYPKTAADLAARLLPGGLFVQWDWERNEGDEHGLSRQQIDEALNSAGLVDVVVATAFTVEVDGHEMSPLIGHGRKTDLAITPS